MNPQSLAAPGRTAAVTTAFATAFATATAPAAEVTDLPATPTALVNAIGSLPTYHNRDDGLGTRSDLLDMSFVVNIDFDEKVSGTREVIWETGGGTVGTSIVYEAPSTIVLRSVGNGGFSLLTVEYPLSSGEIASGPLQLAWTYDVLNGNGTQTISLIVNGQVVSVGELDIGGDWSGSDAAKFGSSGAVAASGANGTINAIAFASGTIDLGEGLAFYADTLWVPIAEDSDADGLPDAWEELYFPGDLTVLASGQDHDSDGLDDELEFAANTDPSDTDSDGDMLTDGREVNPAVPGYTATDPLAADTDADGRSDGDEVDVAPVTDPNERDTDGDRFIDGVEVDAGSDPDSAASTPAIGALLCAYYPLDSLDAGGVSVADLAGGGLDLEARNLDASAIVVGRVGNAIAFDAAAETLLCRDSAAGEPLPISQHQDYTVAMWVNVVGAGQSDLRLFSEASRANSTPLFNLGTNNSGADNSLDVYLRNLSGNNGHPKSIAQPLDGTWHHLAWVRYGESFELYVDGSRDPQVFDFLDPFVADMTTTTSIGGIHRALASYWVTGSIDEVSLWTVALPAADIAELASGIAADALVEDGDSDGIPDHWEVLNQLDPGDSSDAQGNADADSLTNIQEYQRGTDPNLADTDGDSLADDVESNTGAWASATDTGTSPRRADTDGDGLGDAVENPDLPYDPGNPSGQPGTNPNLADSDGDLVGDGAEVAAGSDPTSHGSVPVPEVYFSWCPDEEPLGDTYGPDGVIAATGANPPAAGLEAQGAVPVIAISEAGAAQTGFTQALDFDGVGYLTITPEPNSLRDMLGNAAVEGSGTLELLISPDSLAGGNQYLFESGGTGDGHGLVLVGSTLHFGVNSGNGAPIGQAVASVDLAELYASSFNPDDYLLVRMNTEPLSHIALGVTNLRTGLSGIDRQPWAGNSWDGGDPLALGNFQGGRGGDRDNALSSLPGASTTWAGFDGQVAKFSAYPGILPATISVNTEIFRITRIQVDPDDMITLEWVSFPDEVYSIFSSTDLANFDFEISDGLRSEGERTSFTFPNQQPGEPRIYFRVAKEQ